MDNKGGDQKTHSLHEVTQESKLKGMALMNTKAELRTYLSIVQGNVSELTILE